MAGTASNCLLCNGMWGRDFSRPSSLQMEGAGSSKSLIPVYQPTWRHIPQDSNIQSRQWATSAPFLTYNIDIFCKAFLSVIKHHDIKTWGSGGNVTFILNLHTKWRWVVSFMPRPLYPWWSFDTTQSRPEIWSGRCAEESKPLLLPEVEPRLLDCPARSVVTIPTCKVLQDLSSSQCWWWRLQSSGIRRRAEWHIETNVMEELSASTFLLATLSWPPLTQQIPAKSWYQFIRRHISEV
jgi:hypothetical protein